MLHSLFVIPCVGFVFGIGIKSHSAHKPCVLPYMTAIYVVAGNLGRYSAEITQTGASKLNYSYN
jgi:hypothetical protein